MTLGMTLAFGSYELSDKVMNFELSGMTLALALSESP